MKKVLGISFLILNLFLVGCAEDGKVSEEKIDIAADEIKDGLDDLVGDAQNFLDGDGPDRLKDWIDRVAERGKDLNEDSNVWKDKWKDLKNDPEVKEFIERYEGREKEIQRKLDLFEKEIEADEGLKRRLESIETREEFSEFLEDYDGPGKDVLVELDKTLREIENSGIIEEKINELKNDKELKKLLKKYEHDGKELLKELEDIFDQAQ